MRRRDEFLMMWEALITVKGSLVLLYLQKRIASGWPVWDRTRFAAIYW